MEYLSDGISESLINKLSQLPGVKVIARSSSLKYKDKDVDPQDVARALGVEAILAGRVVRQSDNLLISTELVDARDKTQIWGEQYNRKTTDLLALQSEISSEIAERLRLRLTAGERRQLAKRETISPQAYELLLRGRFYWNKGGNEDRRKAAEYYQKAIEVDPTYALAYAELSVTYLSLTGFSIVDPKEFAPKAEVAARRALELDDTLADAHYALALIKRDAWEWEAAEREFKRAIELNPNLAAAHLWYSRYLSRMGRHEQAMTEIQRARELDPLSLPVINGLAQVPFFARQFDEAIEAFKKAVDLDRNKPLTHLWLGYAYAAKEMYKEAIAEYQEAIKLNSDSPSVQIYLGAAYAKAGEREKAQATLKRLETSKSYVSPAELAILYAALGELEQAFASLERAYAAHDLQFQYPGVDPAFDSLRSDPRFTDLMRRAGLLQG
jgi:TolB-like protein/Tfp pilus assembly protein PilF